MLFFSEILGRHEMPDKENGGDNAEMQIQVQNTKLGISTFWTLEKFQSNLAAMREIEQVVQHRKIYLAVVNMFAVNC